MWFVWFLLGYCLIGLTSAFAFVVICGNAPTIHDETHRDYYGDRWEANDGD